MNNIYKAPAANLEDENSTILDYNSTGWKILLLFILPIEVWSEYEAFTVNEYGDSLSWRLVSLAAYTALIVCLVGLAFKKAFFHSKFWLVCLPILATIDMYNIKDLIFPIEEDIVTTAVILGLFVPLTLLLWYAMFRYSRILALGFNR